MFLKSCICCKLGCMSPLMCTWRFHASHVMQMLQRKSRKTFVGSLTCWTFKQVVTYYVTWVKHLHMSGLVWADLHRVHMAYSKATCVDKTRLWFRFVFVSLFTAQPPSQLNHNSWVPPLRLHRSSSIPHLAKARHYNCNCTYSMGMLLLYIPKTLHDLTTFYQKL
jgi:hypothetical protein